MASTCLVPIGQFDKHINTEVGKLVSAISCFSLVKNRFYSSLGAKMSHSLLYNPLNYQHPWYVDDRFFPLMAQTLKCLPAMWETWV